MYIFTRGDEKMISLFLNKNGNYELLDMPTTTGIADGRPDWRRRKRAVQNSEIWPHRLDGEGHFTALLEKNLKTLLMSTVLRVQLKMEYQYTAEFRPLWRITLT
jgi:hypothetical protein